MQNSETEGRKDKVLDLRKQAFIGEGIANYKVMQDKA